MILGYARVSTKDQNLDPQIDILKKYGCKKIFSEKVSGTKKGRVEFERMLRSLKNGDTLIVTSIDRLGRTSKELIFLLDHLKEIGVNLKSITEGIFDTSSPMGEAVFQIMAVLKAMEVKILKERTMQGLEAARKRGRKGGRKPGSYNKGKAAAVVKMWMDDKPISEILQELKISRSTLYEYLKNEGVNYKEVKKVRLNV